MIIERLSEDTLFLPISARKEVFFVGLQNYLADKGGHCIIRHSPRYFRYSGLVIYKSKLPAPSISMPCDYRILQSPPKRIKKIKSRAQALDFIFLSFDEIIVLGDTHDEINRIGDVEQ